MPRSLVSLLVALALAGIQLGCGSEEQETAQPSAPNATSNQTGPKAGNEIAGFNGIDAENYGIARQTCSALRDKPKAQADPLAFTQHLADGYVPYRRQAVFEGCLAGLGLSD
jgi:hypothetical protein